MSKQANNNDGALNPLMNKFVVRRYMPYSYTRRLCKTAFGTQCAAFRATPINKFAEDILGYAGSLLLSHSTRICPQTSGEKNPLNATRLRVGGWMEAGYIDATLRADITSRQTEGGKDRPRAISAFEVYEENQRSTGDT